MAVSFYNRTAEKGRAVRIRFETDAENNYFARSREPGSYDLVCRDASGLQATVLDYSLNSFNGIATLNLNLPERFGVGDVASLTLDVTDVSRIDPFVNTAEVQIVPFVKQAGGKSKRTKPPSGLAIPKTYWVKEEEWDDYKFNRESVIYIEPQQAADGDKRRANDFYLNEANIHLLREMKLGDPAVIREQFRIGMVLIIIGCHSLLQRRRRW